MKKLLVILIAITSCSSAFAGPPPTPCSINQPPLQGCAKLPTGLPPNGHAKASICDPGFHVIGVSVAGNWSDGKCLGCLNNLQVVCAQDTK